MVCGNRRHATPVVDASIKKAGEILGQIGWRLQVNLRGKDEAGKRQGLEVLLLRAGW
ncbi:unannotated protein [freshwater metagenome]|uniref:Unannotated protein n=1 Tax=freshwater metagenome TaxID=449393 RepID=A0A6J7P0X1_9ZZZZ